MNEDDRAAGPPVGPDDIEGLIDGRLEPGRAAEVEQFMREHPEVATRVLADQALRAELRSRLASAAAEPIPSRLRVATILARRNSTYRRRLGVLAASIALLAVGLGTGWTARGLVGPANRMAPVREASEVDDAIAAHRVFSVETAHPVEVAVAQQAHLVQWLSRRVGQRLTVPNLSAAGYELMGGRVLPAGSAVAAQFMYEDGAAHRLTLYLKVEDGADTAFSYAQASGFSAYSWIDQGLGFALVANIDRGGLQKIAEAVHGQLQMKVK